MAGIRFIIKKLKMGTRFLAFFHKELSGDILFTGEEYGLVRFIRIFNKVIIINPLLI
jgi:hypothetical protein